MLIKTILYSGFEYAILVLKGEFLKALTTVSSNIIPSYLLYVLLVDQSSLRSIRIAE